MKLPCSNSISMLKPLSLRGFFSSSTLLRNLEAVVMTFPPMNNNNKIFYSQVPKPNWIVPVEKYLYTPPVKFPTREELQELKELDFPFVRGRRKLMPFKIFDTTIEKYKLGEGLNRLYNDLVDEVNVQEFFDDFLLPDTFQSWFAVMELHVYVVCCRLMKDDNRLKDQARDAFLEHFWGDIDSRVDKLGFPVTSRQKRKDFRALFFQLQAAFYGYDEGVQSNDMVLAAALWRRFYARECYEAANIERLVKYTRVQLEYLSMVTWDELLFKDAPIVIPLSDVVLHDY